MRKTCVAIVFLALLPFLAIAQEAGRFPSHGYAFVAPGRVRGESESTLHFGVGGVGRIAGNFGLGSEIGYVYCMPCGTTSGVGLFSLNGSYHFPSSKTKVVPFVTAGYSGLFRQGYVNLVNFGGGIDYWFANRAGMKIEFRDYTSPAEGGHLWEFRFGFSFR